MIKLWFKYSFDLSHGIPKAQNFHRTKVSDIGKLMNNLRFSSHIVSAFEYLFYNFCKSFYHDINFDLLGNIRLIWVLKTLFVDWFMSLTVSSCRFVPRGRAEVSFALLRARRFSSKLGSTATRSTTLWFSNPKFAHEGCANFLNSLSIK